jgi:DNA repair exonuclease SbcCD nuclease subunit
MTKIAILSDTHIGFKQGSLLYTEHFKKFYDDVFFPYLEEHDIKHIAHGGDLFDNRKNLNIAAVTDSLEYLFSRLKDYEVKVILGNHDTVYRDTLAVNSPSLFLDDNVLVTEPESWMGIDLIPWINEENDSDVMDFIGSTGNLTCLGHLDLAGFYMNKGVRSHYKSRPSEIFNPYSKVFSGHFHTRSDDEHIYYVGAPYELTWADYDDPRGFVVYDTDTRDHIYVNNPNTLFQQVVYDNGVDEIPQSKIVKLIVKRRDDYDAFESNVKELSDASLDMKIVEVTSDASMTEDDLNDFEVIDTLAYLKGWVDRFDSELHSIDDKRLMNDILGDIYNKAIAL